MAEYINQLILERYITREELIRLTDDENYGVINEDRLNEAINNAESEFKSYIQGVFEEPLPEQLPDMLYQIITDIIIYNLYKRRMRLEMPESINTIYREAIEKLEKIRKGQIVLFQEDNETFIRVNKTNQDKIFPINSIEL